MCGRFTFQPTEAFYARFEIRKRLDSLVPRYNIAPGQMAPVIIANSPRRLVFMRWGLIPHWAKDQKMAYKMINARVETLTQRPTFRGLLSHNRCLVPAGGYYEWKAEGKGKTPYYIHPEDQPYIAFAGLYDVWITPTGEELYTFTISRHKRIPSWRGFTTTCRSFWPESWKMPGWIRSSPRRKTWWTCCRAAPAWNWTHTLDRGW
jgi:putative SOS response-associated peptidase YedK